MEDAGRRERTERQGLRMNKEEESEQGREDTKEKEKERRIRSGGEDRTEKNDGKREKRVRMR